MGAVAQILTYVIQALFGLYLFAVLLRLLLQIARADFYNPLSQFVVKITNPPLKPMRRIIPGVFGIDMAAVVLALLVQMLSLVLIFVLNGYPLTVYIANILVWSILGVLGAIANIYFFAMLISVVMSWVAPMSYHPGAILVRQLCEPVFGPFRKLIPPIGGLDLSAIFAFIALGVVQRVIAILANAAQLPPNLIMGVG
jgi:YggT family protein